jgi:hypothetical protein
MDKNFTTELVKIGDSVICRCKLPVPYNIIARLDTPEAVAEVNFDLISTSPMWELLDAKITGWLIDKPKRSEDL